LARWMAPEHAEAEPCLGLIAPRHRFVVERFLGNKKPLTIRGVRGNIVEEAGSAREMSDGDSAVSLERLLEHADWVKALAASLVRDPATADDVVQETWMAGMKKPPQSAEAARSWLGAVVRNLARRAHRDQGRRRARERAVARPERVSATPERLLEWAELQREIVASVVDLPEPYRSTVLLRYFGEHTREEIAEKEGISATAVGVRLAKALEMLRRRLDRAHGGERGAWASIIIGFMGIEGIGPAAAGGLTAAALDTASPSLWLLGGIAVTQKMVFAIGAIALSTLAVGLVVGRTTARRGADDSSAGDRPVSARDHEDLQRRYEDALAQLARAEAKIAGDARRRRELEEAFALRTDAKRSGERDADPDARGSRPSPASSFDWSGLTKLVSENTDAVIEAIRLGQQGVPYPDDLQKRLGRLGTQIMLYGLQARSLSKYPLLDRALFDGLLRTSARGSLGFSDGQLERLSAANHATFGSLVGDVDPADLLPLERHRLSQEVLGRGVQALEGLLDARQAETWDVLRVLLEPAQSAFIGAVPVKEYGLEAPDVEQEVLADWRKHFSLRDEQAEAFRGAASDYVKKARAALARRGDTDEAIAALSREQRDELKREWLEIQRQEEIRIASHLDEGQRKALADERAVLHSFTHGQNSALRDVSILDQILQSLPAFGRK